MRPTGDVDIVLHIETTRGVVSQTAAALESIGYRLQDALDPRTATAHRFVRGAASVDVVTADLEAVDVLISDHAAPKVTERLRGREMVRMEGGTQALRRTLNARLEILPGEVTTLSVPRPFGALVLKAAAYLSDARDRDRHLYDAAALLACVDDPFAERDGFAGSDRRRVTALLEALPPGHPAWRSLPGGARADAEAVLRILAAS